MSFSNANSGACTPITTRPWSLYLSYHARTYGSVRRQLTHEYVQKSITTTLPRRPAAVSGGELSHSTAPSSDGSVPSIGGGNAPSFAVATGFGVIALPVSGRAMTDSIESSFF